MHTSEAFQDDLPKWEKKGLSISYLPEYSPELNLKYHPFRQDPGLQEALQGYE